MKHGQEKWLALVPLLALPLLAAYPPLEWRALGWVALAPLLLLVKRGPGPAGAWFAAGWGFGALFFAAQYWWLGRTMVELGGLPLSRFALFSLLGLTVLALLPAAALGLCRLAWLRWGLSPYGTLPVLWCLADALLGVAPFGGLPWGSLAGTQTPAFAAFVLAPLAGGPALVLAIVAVNGCWAWCAEGWLAGGRMALRRAALPLAVTLAAAPSWQALIPPSPLEEGFTALLIPGDFTTAATAADAPGRFRAFVARSLAAQRAARADGSGGAKTPPAPSLIVWPEAAAEGNIERGKRLVELSEVATLLEADFLLGSDALERGRSYNAAYLVTGGPFDFRRYDKRELVPFGEYVPAGFRWVFGRKITAGEDDYAAGTAPPVLPWRGRALGVAICFESILPGHMRRAAREGAGVVVAMANDHWLTPAARVQHLWLTALRGMEIGRDVLFVSNGGWSARLADGAVLAPGNAEAPPPPVMAARRTGRTPWVRWGYLPLALLVAGWGAGLALLAWRDR